MQTRHLPLVLAFAAATALILGACGDDKKRIPTGDVAPTDTVSGSDAATGDTASPTDTAPVSDTAPIGDTGPVSDTSIAQDTSTSTDTATGTCSRNGWTPQGMTAAGVSVDGADVEVLYLDSYSSDDGVPYDFLGLELYYIFGASDAPHSFTFADENYATCHTCLLIFADCPDEGECGKIFLARSGNLSVTANGGPGGQFTGSISNITLVEVTIDPDDYTSTPVAGGETWCIPSFAFDEEIATFGE